MLSVVRKQSIEQQAVQVREDYGVESLNLDPMGLAEMAGIEVKAKDGSMPGVSGVLIRRGDNFGILYATHIPNLNYQRFSVAHELGHYFLPEHPEKIFSNGIHTSIAGYAADSIVEMEADHFAACLMMPKTLFVKEMNRHHDGLRAVKALSTACGTSLTATAIRYAQLTHTPVAVIVSVGQHIQYAFLSSAMREICKRYPKKNEALPTKSLSNDFGKRQRNGGEEESDEVDFQSWFGGSRRLEACEEVICLGEYGKNLTLVTVEDLPEEDDDDDWEPPRFR